MSINKVPTLVILKADDLDLPAKTQPWTAMVTWWVRHTDNFANLRGDYRSSNILPCRGANKCTITIIEEHRKGSLKPLNQFVIKCA